jgi:metal-responsive CopG/Arc/MetJ family transcriptional regulator
MRATVTIGDELFERADRAAAELGISRSRLYQQAIELYLRVLRDDALTLQANEAIATYGQPIDAGFRRYIKKAWSEGLGDDEW